MKTQNKKRKFIPKITIKNGFWKQDLIVQRDKLVNIIFWGNVFFIANMVYFLLSNKIIMFFVNAMIFTVYTLIQVSYNKRDKK